MNKRMYYARPNAVEFGYYMLQNYPDFMNPFTNERIKTEKELAVTTGVIIENKHYTFNWVDFHRHIVMKPLAREIISQDIEVDPEQMDILWISMDKLTWWIYNNPDKFEMIIL